MGIVRPNRAWFSLTGQCNNRCHWCYRSGSEKKVFLDFSMVKSYLPTLRGAGVRKFTLIGGEPTLHRQYRSIIDEIIAVRKTSCTLVTNGRRLHDLPVNWSANEQLHIVVSLHGANRGHYAQVAKSEAGFDETVAGIREVVSRKINHSVNIVLSKESLPHINDFLATIVTLNIDTLCFTLAMNSMDSSDYDTDPFSLARACGEVHEKCERLDIKHLFICSIPWCLLGKDLLEKLIARHQLMFNCPVDQGRGLVINEDASLSVCTHLSAYSIADSVQTKMVMSSVADLIAFWNKPNFVELRNAVNVFRHGACLDCRYNRWCKGGCPLWWKHFDFSEVIQRL